MTKLGALDYDAMTPLREVRISPYKPGKGPSFILKIWETGRYAARGTPMLAYELRRKVKGEPGARLLFEGDEYSPSPMHAPDSDAVVADLVGWLTLRPGDTDDEYFEKYTPEQLAWASSNEPEELQAEATHRFDPEAEL